jgi:flagellar biosynthesis anti-sigma factor FlgM
MRVDDPHVNPAGAPATGPAKTQETGRAGNFSGRAGRGAGSAADDVHLSELVRSLRSLAADSPERQARLENIARAYAQGTYQVDADATAAQMIRDATLKRD